MMNKASAVIFDPRIASLLALLLVAAVTWLQAVDPPKAKAPKPVKVLYVTSLPGTHHDYVVQREIFLEIAAKAGWKVTVIAGSYKSLKTGGVPTTKKDKEVAKGSTKESLARYERVMAEIAAQKPLLQLLKKKDYAKGFDAVIYNVCLAHVTDLEATHNIIRQTRANAVPAFLIHCSMHTFWPTFKYAHLKKDLILKWEKMHPDIPFPSWGDFTGIASTGHGPNKPIKTTRLVDHPATRGIAAGYTTPPTELYNNMYKTPGTVALLSGEQTHSRKQKDGTVKTSIAKSVIMWVSPQGKSKVIGLTIGHGDADLKSAGFQSLLVDGVNWMIANPGSDTGAPAPGRAPGNVGAKSK